MPLRMKEEYIEKIIAKLFERKELAAVEDWIARLSEKAKRDRKLLLLINYRIKASSNKALSREKRAYHCDEAFRVLTQNLSPRRISQYNQVAYDLAKQEISLGRFANGMLLLNNMTDCPLKSRLKTILF